MQQLANSFENRFLSRIGRVGLMIQCIRIIHTHHIISYPAKL